MEAHRRGASEVIVEEQVVASEMTRLLETGLARARSQLTEPETVAEASDNSPDHEARAACP
jgi:hypothetical protein